MRTEAGLEILLELLLELLFQLFGELLIELGLQAVAEPFRRQPNVWLAVAGYLVLGAGVGALSLWLFPAHLTRDGCAWSTSSSRRCWPAAPWP